MLMRGEGISVVLFLPLLDISGLFRTETKYHTWDHRHMVLLMVQIQAFQCEAMTVLMISLV